MLWRGSEAFRDALHLLEAAEAAAAAAGADNDGNAAAGTAASTAAAADDAPTADLLMPAGPIRRPFAWRHGMLRPARSAKQARDIARFLPADPAAAAATAAQAVTDAAVLAALVPGVLPELLLPEAELQQAAQPAASDGRKRQRGAAQRAAAGSKAAPQPALGLMVRAGVAIHPASYMRALWLACKQAAAAADAGCSATLRVQPITSLRHLQAAAGPFDAVVVCAGGRG